MKLELYHIAPYLPYELKIMQYRDDLKLSFESFLISLSNNTLGVTSPRFPFNEKIQYHEAKPILRPLSDLHKSKPFIFELRNQENNDTLLWAVDQNTDESFISHYNDELTFSVLEYLYKNHYDIYNLIENNLAIDINAINQ